MKRILMTTLIVAITGSSARADKMKDFLLSCAYGTAAGAAIGVASLVISDDPGSKMNNIARGASLGLYGGIVFGLALANQSTTGETASLGAPALVPTWFRGQVDGLGVQAVAIHF